MPIFVEWEWVEKTKTFLVIFYFNDDFSKTNLRLKNIPVNLGKSTETKIIPTMTWAPTHIEISLLAQLLQYANIIDGFSESIRSGLKRKLCIGVIEGDKYNLYKENLDELFNFLGEKDFMLNVYSEKGKTKKETHFCAELCPDYIEYVSKVIRPYM